MQCLPSGINSIHVVALPLSGATYSRGRHDVMSMYTEYKKRSITYEIELPACLGQFPPVTHSDAKSNCEIHSPFNIERAGCSHIIEQDAPTLCAQA